MKKLIPLSFILACCLVLVGVSHAQDEKKEEKAPESQLMVIHIDEVTPAMNEKYEQLSKQFVNECRKYDIQEVTLWTSRTDENEYVWASPIENMAEMDQKWYTTLMEKMGEEAFTKMFDDMDLCYDKHYTMVVKANHKISMMPSSPTVINENPYRKFTWYHFKPQHMDKAYAVAKEFKELYTSNGIDFYNYTIHEPVFSETGNAFIVMTWAKNRAEYEKIQAMVNDKVGEKRKELFKKVMAITTKKEIKEAEYLPGLSYEPRKLLKAK